MTQPVPYGMLAGQRHELPGLTIPNTPPAPDDINLDAPVGKAPYGMSPGMRHFLPGISPVQPMQPQQAAPPDESQFVDETGNEYGLEYTDHTGKRVQLKRDLSSTSQNRAKQIHTLGSALMDHAHTDQEKAAAERAAAWGLAQSDTDVPVEHVIKEMDESYRRDTGYENTLTHQAMQNEGAMNRLNARFPWLKGGGGGGPVGPTKQDKFDAQQTKNFVEELDGLVKMQRTGYDFKTSQAGQNETAGILAAMQSPNALGQRVAVMKLLKELTGKQQTAREQAAVANAAGIMDAWTNAVSLHNPFNADPELSEHYRQQFVEAIRVAQEAFRKTRAELGEQSVAALHNSLYWKSMDPEQQASAEDYVRGLTSGEAPAPRAAPTPKATAPAKKLNAKDYVP